jgi:hypothetical protein
VTRFAVNYMHRETGFHRFFFLLSLFSAAMLWLVLSGNAVGTFIGWELAGLCSYLLIAYFYERPTSASNATRVLMTNRIGDAFFILGIILSASWLQSVVWQDINNAVTQLSHVKSTVLALCFAIAAGAKSAQLPFTPWLARAMEGPTPSSAVFYGAVMIHAGVYLLILLQPLFEHAPLAMSVIAIVGFITACYSFTVGLTQTDVKSSLVFATSAQLGLMFLECGLGFWSIASWHLCAHAIVRGYGFLTAPSLMHAVHGKPIQPVAPNIAKLRWIYTAALQRFWLDPISDWALVKPIHRFAQDISYFDEAVIERVMGAPEPVVRNLSAFAQHKEQHIGAQLQNEADEFAKGSGLAGVLTEWTADLLHWFEDRFILRGVGDHAINMGRKLGHAANRFEKLILRPRYLLLFVAITLLLAF